MIAYALFETFLIAIGLFFIFYGLKLFKFLIALTGIFVGGLIGMLIGFLVSFEWASIAVFTIIFAVLGMIIAWSVHKFFTYVMVGFWSGLLLGLISLGIGGIEGFIPGFVIGFIIGCILVYHFHEIVIIISIAIPGTILIAYVVTVSVLINDFDGFGELIFGNGINLEGLYSDMVKVNLLNLIRQWMGVVILVVIEYLFYALWYQKVKSKNKADKITSEENKNFRDFVLVLFGFCVANNFFAKMEPYNGHSNLFGFSLLTLPIISIILYEAYVRIKTKYLIKMDLSFIKLFLFCLITVLFIIPLLNWIIKIPYLLLWPAFFDSGWDERPNRLLYGLLNTWDDLKLVRYFYIGFIDLEAMLSTRIYRYIMLLLLLPMGCAKVLYKAYNFSIAQTFRE